jgi:hypothetical protein
MSPAKAKRTKPSAEIEDLPISDGAEALRLILAATDDSLRMARAEREKKNARKLAAGKKVTPVKEDLSYAIYFARHASAVIANALRRDFPGILSGEVPSRAIKGPKRLDVNFGTREAGLGLGISLKSVHRGEEKSGNADFTHNTKRNDEEWRVEATSHHLRQPYAVMVAVIFMPFEACSDGDGRSRSSFGEWVEKLWPLKGRTEAEDAPDLYELVFIAIYARDGTRLAFYEVGGTVKCPRYGEAKEFLTFKDFLRIVTKTYNIRNGKDFFYEGEEPQD